METDNLVEEFECTECGKKVKIQAIDKLLEKICGECWCKKNKEGRER